MSDLYLLSRDPMPAERDAIVALLEGYQPPVLAVFDDYMSDGPGYHGWVAMTIGGEPHICATFTKDTNGTIELCSEVSE